MGNYDKMAEQAGRIFLEHDQDELLGRYPLAHDERFIFIVFLGDEYRIDRATGAVLRGEAPASPRQALSILDMVCNRVGAPYLTGEWRTMQETSGATNAPATSALFEKRIAGFAGEADRLRHACKTLGGTPVPGGEVSYLIEVFEGFPTWLQFWDADEEFGAEMRFLWDKATPLYLHFETLWYILYEILDRLAEECPDSQGT